MRNINLLENSQLTNSNNKRAYYSLTNRILLATGYGSHEELQKTPIHILKTLSNYENLELIGVQNVNNSNSSSRFTELWSEIIENPQMSSLQAAIVSDNIELISKLHSLMIPTLCILHKNTTKEVKKLIQSLALSGTLFVSQWNEKEEIELYIQALLNREWNLSITQRETISTNLNWVKLLINS